MPSKKKKYNARFPAGRIKKIMQSDEEIGKVAQAVPIIISRTLELFVGSLLTKTLKITNARHAKTLSPSHMKQCIMAETRFDFLRELVKNIPDISGPEEICHDSSPEGMNCEQTDTPYDLSMPSTSNNCEAIGYQKSLSSNGNQNNSHINGITRTCGTIISVNSSDSGTPEQKRYHLKRSSAASNSVKTISVQVPKLCRTNSTPAGIRISKIPSSVTLSSALASTSKAVSQQHHSKEPNQPTDLRHLRHQPKSEPGNLHTEPATSQQNKKPQATPTAIPAPIVSLDFYNKPVVKIDYSNLALHDTCYSHPESSSIKDAKNCPSCITIVPSTSCSELATKSPVTNIDLSDIMKVEPSSSSISNSSVNSLAITSASSSNKTVSVAKKNPFLELDEDYDDI